MDQQELENLFDSHYSLIEQKMTMLTSQMDTLRMKVEEICNNHLAHIKEEQMEIKTNVEWLMKFFWLVAGASIVNLLATIFSDLT